MGSGVWVSPDGGPGHFLHPEPYHLVTELSLPVRPRDPLRHTDKLPSSGWGLCLGRRKEGTPEDAQLRSRVTCSKHHVCVFTVAILSRPSRKRERITKKENRF